MLLQPDSELYIVPAAGGEARRMACNTGRMNSWHSWSPNGRWLVFSSKADSDFTQLYLTHVDDDGNSSPPVLLAHLTAPDRAANIPEFVNAAPDAIAAIRAHFLDDTSFVRAGDAFLRAGDDVAGAIEQFKKALAINPDNAVAHSNLGGLLVNTGDIAGGVEHLEEAIRLDPANGSASYNLGMLRFRQGEIDAAIENLTLAVRCRPELADARRVLGACLCRKGRRTAGIEQLSEAARLDPQDAVTRYYLGTALASAGAMDQARGHLSQAVALAPDDVPALRLLSQLEFQAGQARAAIAHLTHAVQVDPNDPRMLGDLALMLTAAPDPALRDPARAVECAERACGLTNRQVPALLDLLGSTYAAAGRFRGKPSRPRAKPWRWPKPRVSVTSRPASPSASSFIGGVNHSNHRGPDRRGRRRSREGRKMLFPPRRARCAGSRSRECLRPSASVVRPRDVACAVVPQLCRHGHPSGCRDR
jgi:tetratricopeptide (TPR) repeat protein